MGGGAVAPKNLGGHVPPLPPPEYAPAYYTGYFTACCCNYDFANKELCRGADFNPKETKAEANQSVVLKPNAGSKETLEP